MSSQSVQSWSVYTLLLEVTVPILSVLTLEMMLLIMLLKLIWLNTLKMLRSRSELYFSENAFLGSKSSKSTFPLKKML